MGKDVFNQQRFHCTEPGCDCDDFQSCAQADMAKAEAMQEEEGNSIEVLESAFSRMSCQAKSEYQLTCVCKHGATKHSTKKRELRIQTGLPGTLYVLQGVVFRKTGSLPHNAAVTKLKRTVGAALQTTGRSWVGPSGGEWAELQVAEGQKPGWVLVEGPGFGIEGPILGKDEPEPQAQLPTPTPAVPEASAPQTPATAAVTQPLPGAPPVPVAVASQVVAPEPAAPKESFSKEEARGVLNQIGQACRSPEFAQAAEDPLQVGELFIKACARPAADLGFGASEEGVLRLFAALRPFAQDSPELRDLERSLQLEPGSVFALVESM